MVADKHRLSLLGAQLSLYSEAELLSLIHTAIREQRSATILSGNVYAYNLAYEHPWLRQYFNQVDAVRLDGVGVRLAAYLLGHRSPPRMTWADFGWSLAAFAEKENISLFLLGSKPGIAEKAAERLRSRYPNLQIAGVYHGYFNKETGSAENEAVLQRINASKPDILIVGFGMPLQERWLLANRDRIEANVVLTGGAVFDYLSGELRRGPKWLTDYGFEWLARMLIEPKRLWKRYVIGNPLFLWRVFKQRFGFLTFPAESRKQ